MIDLVMSNSGMVAHIRDRHVTWCGAIANPEGQIPAHPRICAHCIKQIVADGAVTDEEMGQALKSWGRRATITPMVDTTPPETHHGPPLRYTAKSWAARHHEGVRHFFRWAGAKNHSGLSEQCLSAPNNLLRDTPWKED